MEKARVTVFDTTLRDGEQSPGCSMNEQEKLRLALQLDRLGVDVIEAGFPIASEGDFAAVQAIAAVVRRPVIAGLARACAQDIESAWQALKGAERPRIHVFLATSDIHLQYKLKITRQQCLQQARDSVRLAKSFCTNVEFSPEDATRTDPEFLFEILNAVVEAGATTLNIPDTVGYTMPAEFASLIRNIGERVRAIENVIISAHCHDDGIVSEQLYPASQMLSEITGVPVQPNKAIIGRNAFAHEAGIHQDGMLKNPLTYEIMTPQSVGVPDSKLVLGKHSGRHALGLRCEQLGYQFDRRELDEVYRRFVILADKIKHVEDHHLLELIGETRQETPRIPPAHVEIPASIVAAVNAYPSPVERHPLEMTLNSAHDHHG